MAEIYTLPLVVLDTVHSPNTVDVAEVIQNLFLSRLLSKEVYVKY